MPTFIPGLKLQPTRTRNTASIGNSDTNFVCTTCGKIYQYKQTLVRHIRYVCQKEPMHECPVCNRRMHIKSNLVQHLRTHMA